jgi:hypothetical protein
VGFFLVSVDGHWSFVSGHLFFSIGWAALDAAQLSVIFSNDH